MEMRIEWSAISERQLKEIFNYYSIEATPTIAKKIINRIINRVFILKDHPLSGPREELLIEYSEEFRYLVESNYKIIYWICNDVITIASVYDCRQNPVKMKKLL